MILSVRRLLRSLVRPIHQYNSTVISCTTARPISTTPLLFDSEYLSHIRDATAAENNEEVLWVPKYVGRLVIGKGGATVRDITARTDAFIQVDFEASKDGMIPVLLKGSLDACTEAREIIDQLNYGTDDDIWVPVDKVGILIGRGGAKIKDLQQDTDTRININKELMKDGSVPLTIVGESKNVAKVKLMVQQQLLAYSESTVWVPKERAGLIISSGGARITSLEKDTGTTISVNNELIKDGLVPFTIVGKPEKCAEVEETIKQQLLDSSESTVWVPKNKAGLIIGRGGARITSLGKDTGTIINLNKELIKDGLVPFTIVGKPEKCAEVEETIKQQLLDSSESTVWVPKNKAGLIIGRGGARITSLGKDTGTKINVNKELIKDGLVPLTIVGEPESCAVAKETIEQQLLAHSVTTVIWVPKERAGLIIGSGGATITSLEKDTGTKMYLTKNLMKDGLVPLTIVGEPESCAVAKETIEQQLLAHSVTTVWVPKERAGLIVGKGGARIKSFEKDTGTKINVNKELIKDGLVPLTIVGSPNKCAAAKEMIEQQLESTETTL